MATSIIYLVYTFMLISIDSQLIYENSYLYVEFGDNWQSLNGDLNTEYFINSSGVKTSNLYFKYSDEKNTQTCTIILYDLSNTTSSDIIKSSKLFRNGIAETINSRDIYLDQRVLKNNQGIEERLFIKTYTWIDEKTKIQVVVSFNHTENISVSRYNYDTLLHETILRSLTIKKPFN